MASKRICTAGQSTSDSLTTLPATKDREPAQFGNFRRYYSIRREAEGGNDKPHESRLECIQSWLRDHPDCQVYRQQAQRRVLDVGCNSGEFTLSLYSSLQGDGGEGQVEELSVIGADVDRELVLLAGSHARRLQVEGSECEKSKSTLLPRVLGSGRSGRGGGGGPRKRLRLVEPKQEAAHSSIHFLQSDWVYNDYLAREIRLGRAKVEKNDTDDDKDKEANKREEEVLTRMQIRDSILLDDHDSQSYNLLLALSVTKWIHIHHYDAGIRRFFARVAFCLRPNGVFIMEYQPYKSYKHTLKVTPPGSQARRNFYALRVMPDDFAWILTVELGLKGPFPIRKKGDDASVRQIDAYIQPATDHIPHQCLERRAALLAIPQRWDPLLHLADDSIPWVSRRREMRA